MLLSSSTVSSHELTPHIQVHIQFIYFQIFLDLAVGVHGIYTAAHWEERNTSVFQHRIKGLDKQIGNKHTDPTEIGLARDPPLAIEYEPDQEGDAHIQTNNKSTRLLEKEQEPKRHPVPVTLHSTALYQQHQPLQRYLPSNRFCATSRQQDQHQHASRRRRLRPPPRRRRLILLPHRLPPLPTPPKPPHPRPRGRPTRPQ